MDGPGFGSSPQGRVSPITDAGTLILKFPPVTLYKSELFTFFDGIRAGDAPDRATPQDIGPTRFKELNRILAQASEEQAMSVANSLYGLARFERPQNQVGFVQAAADLAAYLSTNPSQAVKGVNSESSALLQFLLRQIPVMQQRIASYDPTNQVLEDEFVAISRRLAVVLLVEESRPAIRDSQAVIGKEKEAFDLLNSSANKILSRPSGITDIRLIPLAEEMLTAFFNHASVFGIRNPDILADLVGWIPSALEAHPEHPRSKRVRELSRKLEPLMERARLSQEPRAPNPAISALEERSDAYGGYLDDDRKRAAISGYEKIIYALDRHERSEGELVSLMHYKARVHIKAAKGHLDLNHRDEASRHMMSAEMILRDTTLEYSPLHSRLDELRLQLD